MALSSKEMKAIAWYAKDHRLRPQLSAYPLIRFKDFMDNTVEEDVTVIAKEYEAWNEEDKKARARQRAQDLRYERKHNQV